jgi:hypothetical protein
MNARIERVINSENLGARIMRNGALDQKIWALKACRGKTIFSGGSGVIMEFLEWLEGLGSKDRDSCKIWEFFRDFCGFFECLVWFRTYL